MYLSTQCCIPSSRSSEDGDLCHVTWNIGIHFISNITWRFHVKFGFNSLVCFEEEKFENIESEWSRTKVNE